jgi:hypothetical protein
MDFDILNQVRKKLVQKGKEIAKDDSFLTRNIHRFGTDVRNLSALGVPLNQRFTRPKQ